MTSKIVVIGDVAGQIAEVFAKVAALHAKNKFAFALIAGNLFEDASTNTETSQHDLARLLQGEIEIPLPTYFSLGTRPLPAAVTDRLTSHSGEICPNLFVLGRKVSIKTSEGINIVAIGGAYTTTKDAIESEYAPTYCDTDVQSAKAFKRPDILLTSNWPSEIASGSKAITQASGQPLSGIQSLGELCSELKPRYHFSTSDSFFEREPFFHDGPAPREVTRFLSLAPFGNTNKQKWIYAFSLQPNAPAPDTLPPGTTACPFTASKKRKLETQQDSFNTFRFANGSGQGQNAREGGKRRRAPPPKPQECYFCLSNPACETHMIGSLGTDVYLATAKGPLSTATTFPTLGFPSNILLIPLNHTPTIAAIADQDARTASVTEMKRYQGALHDMLAAKSNAVADGDSQLGAVTWEISRRSGVHVHWQFLPLPKHLVESGMVEAGFEVEAENLTYPKFVKDLEKIDAAMEGDYFRAMIWCNGSQKDIVLPLDQTFRFDLQFGRRVLGKLLGLESRTNWRDCSQSKAEEERDANAFKDAFAPFDFSLEE